MRHETASAWIIAITLALISSSWAPLAQSNDDSSTTDPAKAVIFAVTDQDDATNENKSANPDDDAPDKKLDELDIANLIGTIDDGLEVVSAAAMTRMKKQEQPELDPTVEQAPTTPAAPAATELSSVFSASQASIVSQLSAARQADGATPGSDFVLGLESSILNTTDAGDLLSRSNAILGVGSEHRTPIVTYNVARGRNVGQQSGSGSYWFPARQDLDTLMSKIDSRIVDNFLVIKGPYSALYGPGFAFYDVELLRAPRYDNSFESHGSTSLDWNENGDQWYGRQTFLGGGPNWGFRIGYGDRLGSDYRTGQGSGPFQLDEMPSSYHSRDWDLALGYDLSPYQHVDFSYLRLDQTDVEFPGQIFDFDFLVTDAFDIEYVNECPCVGDRVVLEGWYNRTRFEGNAQNAGKRRQIPLLDIIDVGFFTGPLTLFTDVDASSAGYSFSATWGQPECTQLTLGTDLRYLKQELNEFTDTLGAAPPNFFPQNNPIPRSYSANPGVFVELNVPMTCQWDVRAGGRGDWVYMNAVQNLDVGPLTGTPDDLEQLLGGSFDQSFDLGSAYITSDYQLGCHWKASAGGGFAMRPPTMTEMYAVNPFVAIFPQLVFTSLRGNPNLEPERMWQVDVSLTAEYCNFRGGMRGYHAWIDDYITYEVGGTLGGILFRAVNESVATLKGYEVYGEVDLTCRTTLFTTVSYVEGKNELRDEPLPTIPPLDARAGVRLHEPSPNPLWSIEFAARVVQDQDRFAASLNERPTPGFATFDLRAYAQLTDKFLFTIGVENLFDRFYQEHLDPHETLFLDPGFNLNIANFGVYQPGTNFYTGFVREY